MRADLRRFCLGWAERLDPWPRRRLFGRDLLRFPLPVRGALPTPLPEVAILTPCRDAAERLGRYFELIEALDYPKDRLHLCLLEGDSTDDTRARAAAGLEALGGAYAGTRLLRLDLADVRRPGSRRRLELQRSRRAAIAACRNRLLQAGLETGAEAFLFVDVDMAEIPSGTLKELLRWDAPILMPNCLRHDEDIEFDRNAFRYIRAPSDRAIRAYGRDGLYQPPAGFFRHYPRPDSRAPVEPLDSVGGTVLLIRRAVAEAGADFPETPYRWHIETEGFALKAAELGHGAFMLPRLIVRHGPH